MSTRFQPRDERGTGMVLSLLILLVLSAVGLGSVLQSKTETRIAGNELRRSQSLFNAEAGVAEGIARMQDPDSMEFVGEAPGTVSPGWGVYVVDETGASLDDPNIAALATDGLDNDLDGETDEQGERYPEVMTLQTDTDAIPYPWVRVEYRRDPAGQIVLFGDHDSDPATPPIMNLAVGAPALRVSSEGRRGTARRCVEIQAAKPPLSIVHAAIYAEDDDFKFNGTSFLISGQDWDPVVDQVVGGNPEFPGISTTLNPNEIVDALHNNQTNNVEGDGAEPSVNQSAIDLDLQAMVDTWALDADIVAPSGTYSNVNWGDVDDYMVVHATGDIHLSGNVTGGGVCVIDGDLDCTGQFTWYGLVIILGDIRFSGGGAGTHIFGSLLVQGGFDQQVVGGQADIKYSSAALEGVQEQRSYKVISWRETLGVLSKTG